MKNSDLGQLAAKEFGFFINCLSRGSSFFSMPAVHDLWDISRSFPKGDNACLPSKISELAQIAMSQLDRSFIESRGEFQASLADSKYLIKHLYKHKALFGSVEQEQLRIAAYVNNKEVDQFFDAVVKLDVKECDSMLWKNPSLAYVRDSFSGLIGKTFQGITGFQHAVWSTEIKLIHTFASFLTPEQREQQIADMPKVCGSSHFSGEAIIEDYMEHICLKIRIKFLHMLLSYGYVEFIYNKLSDLKKKHDKSRYLRPRRENIFHQLLDHKIKGENYLFNKRRKPLGEFCYGPDRWSLYTKRSLSEEYYFSC